MTDLTEIKVRSFTSTLAFIEDALGKMKQRAEQNPDGIGAMEHAREILKKIVDAESDYVTIRQPVWDREKRLEDCILALLANPSSEDAVKEARLLTDHRKEKK